MALIICYECKNSISDQATSCVHCGALTHTYLYGEIVKQKAETPSMVLNIFTWVSIYYAFIYLMMNLFGIFPSWSYAFFQYYFEINNFKIFPWYWLPIPSFIIMHIMYPKKHGEWLGYFIILSWIGVYFMPTMI
tara:strand:- start:132 stop:533 length:402 start_codon:yes stop_codon:yes gene_type:complete